MSGFRASLFDTIAKRVFYRLHGAFSKVIKKINNKTLTPKVKHGNV